MKITSQHSPNECGVCVINSYVDHYYKYSDKLKILNEANIGQNGLSIFDFENLGQKFGLYIESYEASWAEFCSLKNNQFYSLLVNKDNAMHYLIVYKKKNGLEVYDSLEHDKYETSYNKFESCYAGIVFNITKSKTKIQYNKQKIKLQSIDLKYLFVSLLLHLAIIGLSTIFANLFNWTLEIGVYGKSTSNLLALCFIFCLIAGMNVILNYILKFYGLIRFKQNFRYLLCKLIASIKSKNNSIINKVDPNSIYLLDSSVVTICNFLTIEITSLITDGFMIVLSLIILCFIKPAFLIICLISLIVNVIFGIFNFNFKEKNLNEVIKNSNLSNNYSKSIIEHICNEQNEPMLDFYIDKYKDNFYQFEKIYTKKATFDNSLNSLESMCSNIIYIVIIGIGGIYLIQDTLTIGNMCFLVSLLGMYSSSVNNICIFPSKVKEYKKMSNIYWSIVGLGNLIKDSYISSIKQIKKICFKINGIDMEVIKNKIYENINIDVNNYFGINVSNQQNKSFFKQNYIKINPDTKIDPRYLINNNLLSDKKFKDSLSFFKINFANKTFTLRQQQIINFLFCLSQTNKIICFNDCFRYLTKEQYVFVKDKIKTSIAKDNFVFYTNN